MTISVAPRTISAVVKYDAILVALEKLPLEFIILCVNILPICHLLPHATHSRKVFVRCRRQEFYAPLLNFK